MARKPRPSEEVEAIKQRILENALQIIARYGYDGLTMRKLAKNMSLSATAIYRYYESKEEIFLKLRARGFTEIYEKARLAFESCDDPFERLQIVTRVIIDYALSNPYYYRIMLTWDVPMYDRFVGTPLQPVAEEVRRASMPSVVLGIRMMEAIAESYRIFPKEDARLQFILWMTGIHGIVSLYSNTILNYLDERPIDILYPLAERFIKVFKPEHKDK